MAFILVVDGDGAQPSSLHSRLIKEGYHTLGVRDANEAIQTMKCIRADLLIADVRAVNGIAQQLLTTLRRDAGYRALPVLFIDAGPSEYGKLNPAVQPGAVLVQGQSWDDVMSNVRAYVAPSLALHN